MGGNGFSLARGSVEMVFREKLEGNDFTFGVMLDGNYFLNDGWKFVFTSGRKYNTTMNFRESSSA